MKKDLVRYVPAICGSPGTMSREQAERELRQEMEVIETMTQAGIGPDRLPYIEETTGEKINRRKNHRRRL